MLNADHACKVESIASEHGYTKPLRRQLLLYCLVCLCMSAVGPTSSADSQAVDETDRYRYSASVNRDYDEVVEDVKFAIANHNFRITGGNNIGGAIAERHELNFPASEIVHFCNLEYARKMIELEPEFVLHMPCKVIVREAADRVIVETRLLPASDGQLGTLSAQVNDILRSIVDQAVE